MDAAQYYNALKFLEKTGSLVVSEHLRESSKIHFKMDGEALMRYYPLHPQIEEFVKLLLRSYAGVFTQFVNIQEEVLAQRAELTVAQVEEMLKALRADKVLSYEPQSEIPLIMFLENRVEAKHLFFDPKDYDDRKQRAQERLEAVIQYVTTDHICRSRQLLSYFGETKSTPCGSCDVCLARKKRMRQEQEDEIRKAIRDLYQQDVTLREILDRLAGRYAEDDLLETMRQMVEDGDLLH